MPPPAQQFTPSQILEAGRRAEAEGRTEYAIQFYRHLVDHHGSAPEAEAAHDALVLIEARRAGGGPPPFNGAEFRPGPPPVPAADRPPRLGSTISLGLVGVERPLPLILPAPRRAYRTGRLIARLLTWMGGGSVLAGVAANSALLFAPDLLARLPEVAVGWLFRPFVAPAMAGSGILAMLLGQLARAVLDSANATCDMAATTRAQAEHQADAIAIQSRD
ncbi:MAG TPA: hypothetical protein VNK52_05250 [Hyphomicrobiaceae bacterium]|nr:hypothetical protein [Hyphomicrobiaceae bacterium]